MEELELHLLGGLWSDAAATSHGIKVVVAESSDSLLSNSSSSSRPLLGQRAAGSPKEPRRVEQLLPVVLPTLYGQGTSC